MGAQWGETLVILCTLDNRLLTYVYLTLTSMTGSRKVFPEHKYTIMLDPI